MTEPWTEAWEEAEASAPAGITQIDTIELRHPLFLDGMVLKAVRIVANVEENMTLGLEDTAAMNGGEMVEWEAVNMKVDQPQIEEGRPPSANIAIDNVTRYVQPRIQQAARARGDLIATYRQYRSDILDEPSYGPIDFVLKAVEFSGTQMTGVLQIDNLANKRFPNKSYSIRDFPGLRG